MNNNNFKCYICGNTNNNKKFTVREMMFGFGDEFDYYECANCKCLQIAEIPSDLSKYYPAEYYSFDLKNIGKDPLVFRIISQIIGKIYINTNFINEKSTLLRKFGLSFIEKIKLTKVNFNSRILDVGSGTGEKLNVLASAGFKNLTGIDPFIDQDISYKSGVKIYKKDIYEMKDQYDMIMLNHSFEHMVDPYKVLKEVYRLLKPGHIALIRIPIADSYSWKKYGVNWVNLDAPRHFYLHTIKSMKILASKENFELVNILFDSDDCQFWVSEQYSKGIPMHSDQSYFKNKNNSIFSGLQIKQFKEKAKELNKKREGDKACFYLKKL